MEWHAQQPQLQCLPVNARHDGQCHERMAQKGEQDTARAKRGRTAGEARQQQRAVLVVVIDAAGSGGAGTSGLRKPETITPADRKEGRDMKYLARLQRRTLGDGAAITPAQEVAVGFAEGVADFGKNCAQASRLVFAEPEAHWIEGVTKYAREALQPHLAVGASQALPLEQRAYPWQWVCAVARAVVAEVETGEVEAVDRK